MTHQTTAEIREQLRGMALSLATGSGPIVEPAAFDAALDAYRDAVLAEAAAVSAAVAPPTQAALRDRIAEALMQWAESNNSPQYGAMRRPETVVQNAYSRADAVLAVLPSAADWDDLVREADRLRRDGAALHARAEELDTQLTALRQQVTEPTNRTTAEAALDAARATNQRLNREKQRLESELATYRKAVTQWEISEHSTYVPLRSLAAIAKAAGVDVPDRYEAHYERVERAEAELRRMADETATQTPEEQ